MMVGNAERGVMIGEQIEDRLFVPARMPELDGVAAPLGQQLQEGGQPFVVPPQHRRKLHQRRTVSLPQARHSPEHQIDESSQSFSFLLWVM